MEGEPKLYSNEILLSFAQNPNAIILCPKCSDHFLTAEDIDLPGGKTARLILCQHCGALGRVVLSAVDGVSDELSDA